MKPAKDIDSYIQRFSEPVQQKLQQMRSIIRRAAPQATETISYQMPAFRLNGVLVWFAAHSQHIGFYPRASGISAFKTELEKYKTARGSVRFPLSEPLPVRLITRIVKFRVAEDKADQEGYRSRAGL